MSAGEAGAVVIAQALDEALTKYDDHLRREPKHASASEAPALVSTPFVSIPFGSPTPKIDTGGIKRPNGELYVPRNLKGLGVDGADTTDVTFIQTAYAKRMPVLLSGPPGTGKTALFEAALPGLITLMGSSETEVADFIGTWVPNPDGKYEWVDGPLVQAMEYGLPLLIDEVALVDARTMSVVYPVMDGRDELPITANPARGVAKAKEGFVVYGACNPNVPGAIMSDALLSRFRLHPAVTSDWTLAKNLGVGPKIITVAKNLAIKESHSEVVAAPQIRELLTYQETLGTFGENVALRNFIAQSRIEDRATYVAAVAAVFGNDLEPLTF